MGEVFELPDQLGNLESGGTVIPNGSYGMVITSAKLETGSADKYVRVQYEVLDGTFKGARPFPDQLSLAPKAVWKIAAFLKALGADGKLKKFNTDVLKGKKIIATAFQEEYQGSARNKYLNYLKYDAETLRSIQESESQGKKIGGDAAAATEGGEEGGSGQTDWGQG